MANQFLVVTMLLFGPFPTVAQTFQVSPGKRVTLSMAHWDRNPMERTIEKFAVTSKTILKIPVVEGEGYAVTIGPALLDFKGFRNSRKSTFVAP